MGCPKCGYRMRFDGARMRTRRKLICINPKCLFSRPVSIKSSSLKKSDFPKIGSIIPLKKHKKEGKIPKSEPNMVASESKPEKPKRKPRVKKVAKKNE